MPKIVLCTGVLIAFFATWVHPVAEAQEAQSLIEAARIVQGFSIAGAVHLAATELHLPRTLPPKLVWRDAEAARKFGCAPGFVIRWFDSNLEEAKLPNEEGDGLLCYKDLAPIKTQFRRALTLYALPAQLDRSNFFIPNLTAKRK